MFSISPNGIIQISRGDTCYGNLFINIGTELEPRPYQLEDGDVLYFGVTEPNGSFRDSLICKRLTKEDKTPGEPPTVGDPLRVGQKPTPGYSYYTREETTEPVGYLVGQDPKDGKVYRYTYVELDIDEPVTESDTYYPLFYLGYDYVGYYVINFNTEDTEHVVPGVYYYEIKLARPDVNKKGEEYQRVDTIVSKTKFIVLE